MEVSREKSNPTGEVKREMTKVVNTQDAFSRSTKCSVAILTICRLHSPDEGAFESGLDSANNSDSQFFDHNKGKINLKEKAIDNYIKTGFSVGCILSSSFKLMRYVQ